MCVCVCVCSVCVCESFSVHLCGTQTAQAKALAETRLETQLKEKESELIAVKSQLKEVCVSCVTAYNIAKATSSVHEVCVYHAVRLLARARRSM